MNISALQFTASHEWGEQMPIKVLIVDDSIVFRQIIAKGIQTDPEIEVVATATDPFDARDKILKYEPNVLTCDIEMPKMNGIEFIRRLLPQYSIPTIVVSSVSDKVFDAMDAGAVDFVTKPDAQSPEGVQRFIKELIGMIKAASKAHIENQILKSPVRSVREKNPDAEIRNFDLIAIGASTGGTEAIFNLLMQLPAQLPGIVIVQHIPPVFSRMFADRLNKQTVFQVKEAENGDLVERRHVYVAPGDKHVQIRKTDRGYMLKVFEGEKVNGHCPSVDVMFNSVAEEAGARAMGVILTGMGYDGAKGITLMKRRGAVTIGQDEKTSVVYGMPKAAYDLKGVLKQSAIDTMGHCMMQYLK